MYLKAIPQMELVYDFPLTFAFFFVMKPVKGFCIFDGLSTLVILDSYMVFCNGESIASAQPFVLGRCS